MRNYHMGNLSYGEFIIWEFIIRVMYHMGNLSYRDFIIWKVYHVRSYHTRFYHVGFVTRSLEVFSTCIFFLCAMIHKKINCLIFSQLAWLFKVVLTLIFFWVLPTFESSTQIYFFGFSYVFWRQKCHPFLNLSIFLRKVMNSCYHYFKWRWKVKSWAKKNLNKRVTSYWQGLKNVHVLKNKDKNKN